MSVKALVLASALEEPGTSYEIAHRLNRTLGSIAAHLTLLYQAGAIDRTDQPSRLKRDRSAYVYHGFGVRIAARALLSKAEIEAEQQKLRGLPPLPGPDPRYVAFKNPPVVLRRATARRIVTTFCRARPLEDEEILNVDR